ncbi:MAG: high-potential iron-sulfur protein [Halioglobus sp.]|nr:high-potential iron-sulfur protein [Halioglobus sp.]
MKKLTRRHLLRQTRLLPLVAVPVPLLSGCGEEPVSGCSAPELLTRGDLEMRGTMAYTDRSPDSDQTCGNCLFFQGGEFDGCGGCNILAGIIDREGYCESWAQRI